MNPDVSGRSHGGHRLPFCEDLRVWSYSHFEVLRPDALCNERIFDSARLRRAWTYAPKVAADDGDDRLADSFRFAGIASRLFFDDALEEACHERHAAGFDRLKIARREEPWCARGPFVVARVVQDF